MRDLRHARGHELDAEDELVLPELAVTQRDLSHLELHAPSHQVLHARVEEAEAVLGAFHQEIDAVGVGHRNEPRLGIDFEMIVDIAQALGGLLDTAVEVVDGFLLRPGENCEERKRQAGKQILDKFHWRLLFRDLYYIAHFTRTHPHWKISRWRNI